MIIAVTSWRGWGATTASLALATAAARDGDAWLVEADPAGGVLAGRIALERATVGGLERVAFPPQSCSLVEAFHEVAHDHRGLRIVSAPLDPYRALACHRPRADWIGGLSDLDGTVVVDAGRMRAGSPAWPLLRAAHTVLCVTSPEVSTVVATTEWFRSGGRVGPSDRGLDEAQVRVAVVDAPSGVGFARHTLQADLGPAIVGWLPWDPAGVDRLHHGTRATGRGAERRSRSLSAASALILDKLRGADDASPAVGQATVHLERAEESMAWLGGHTASAATAITTSGAR